MLSRKLTHRSIYTKVYIYKKVCIFKNVFKWKTYFPVNLYYNYYIKEINYKNHYN